jgi:hypothetical protein
MYPLWVQCFALPTAPSAEVLTLLALLALLRALIGFVAFFTATVAYQQSCWYVVYCNQRTRLVGGQCWMS